MRTHTYKSENSKFNCVECTFIGENEWTMQIHNGKHHMDQIECGLCEFQAKDISNLDMHLSTCKTYECVECEHVSKQLSDMKKHLSEKTF